MTASVAAGRCSSERVAVDGVFELRNAEADRVEPWVAAGDYDAAVVMAYSWPGGPPVDPAVTTPLWRPFPLVAVAPSVRGVVVNSWALGPAWNAADWYRPPADR